MKFELFEHYLKSAKHVSFWWRDDDVGGDRRIDFLSRWKHERRLENVLSLLTRYNIPSVFAVIPNHFFYPFNTQIKLLKKHKAYVALHGITHHNNSSNVECKSEFPDGCDIEPLVSKILVYQAQCRKVFGERSLPVFVPPYNRICLALENKLLESGFLAVSKSNSDGVVDVNNSDIDLVDWRKNDIKNEEDILNDIASAIERFDGNACSIGILNHHMRVSTKGLVVLERILKLLTNLRNVAWMIPPDFLKRQ
jgi:peptidoglycan/xylan/chitin deacetylase (PgdA/CDA1 family)